MENLKILSINAWGLPKPFSVDINKRFKKIVWLIKNENPDIVALQEIWMIRYVQKLRKHLKSYFVITSKKGFQKNVSGLVTLIKKRPVSFKFKAFKNNYLNLKEKFSKLDEVLGQKGFLRTDIKINKRNFSIINTHLFARSKKIQDKHIYSQLKKIEKEVNKLDNVLIVGDFNMTVSEFKEWSKKNLKYVPTDSPTLDPKNPYRKFISFKYISDGKTINHLALKTKKIKFKLQTKTIKNFYVSDEQPLISEISF